MWGRKLIGGVSNRGLLLEDETSTNANLQEKRVVLYDPDAMIEMKSALCQGYLTLLTGACEQSKRKGQVADESAMTLAFLSLTNGNVVDACFGSSVSSKPSDQVKELIKEAKDAIDDAAHNNERVERIAVSSYKKAFETVVDQNKKLEKLNIITACFCEKKIRLNAVTQLHQDFRPLEQAIQSAF